MHKLAIAAALAARLGCAAVREDFLSCDTFMKRLRDVSPAETTPAFGKLQGGEDALTAAAGDFDKDIIAVHARQIAIEHDDVGGKLSHAIPLDVERILGRRDQQAQQNRGHCSDDPRGEPHCLSGVFVQMVLRESRTQQHSQQRTSEYAAEYDSRDGQ